MPDLRRSIKLPHATAMVVGIIVGASIFIQPSEITRLVPSVSGILLVWVAAGGLTLCGALVCAELASVFPHTGGVYIFLKDIFSPVLGFLWGWAMFWSVHSGILAAIAVVLARYVAFFRPLNEVAIRAVAIGAILLLSAINYLGVKSGSVVQLALTAAKLAAIVLMVVLLFWFGGGEHASHSTVVSAQAPSTGISGQGLSGQSASAIRLLKSYGLAIAAGLFAFGGWHMVTYSAGETYEPERTIPRALMAGTLIVTACYVLLNAGYLYVLPLTDVANSTRVAADATSRILGPRAGAAIAMLVIFSALGALNGIILAGPRVYYAMARDGLAFRWMAAVHPRFQTPHWAIVAQAIWSSVLVATNRYRDLFNRVVYSEWLFFALLAAGLFILQRRGYRPKLLGRGYPVLPLVFIAASVLIVLNQCIANPRGSAIGMGLILLGLPVYFVWSRRVPGEARANADH
ncbi:MAG TPA: amino acid permease [Candidatus Angelobacter sp.]|jgi:APA family basic amino acid/polyamine antiporter|nr:amino acid permease [Candidatus Angelobacter sp.]